MFCVFSSKNDLRPEFGDPFLATSFWGRNLGTVPVFWVKLPHASPLDGGHHGNYPLVN